jgi:arylsulfatase
MLRTPAVRLLLVSSITLPLLFAVCRRAPVSRPHVVLILIDALRARSLGCYGYAGGTSPEIDRLAREGVLFEQAITEATHTAAAIPALFTGHYPFFETGERWADVPFGMDRFGQTPGTKGLPESMTTLAEYLSAAGYQTAGFVTNPYLKSVFNMQQGFDHYEEIFDEHGSGRAGQVVRRVLRYSDGLDWKKPTFLYLHFMDTHSPYRAPDPSMQASIPEPARAAEYRKSLAAWANPTQTRPGEHEDLRRYMTALYDASIRRADGAVGRILRHLQDRQLIEKTLVIVTADHGEEFLEHGGTYHKWTFFEELVHVPLILRVPGGPRGVRRPELVRSFDITPTILDYAGIATAARHMEARSFRALLEGGRFHGPREVYGGFPALRMLRTDRYKLLRYGDGREAFYDLRRDPREEHDLAQSGDERIRRAHASLAQRLDQTVDGLRAQGVSRGSAPEGGTIDEATREQLKALGYID